MAPISERSVRGETRYGWSEGLQFDGFQEAFREGWIVAQKNRDGRIYMDGDRELSYKLLSATVLPKYSMREKLLDVSNLVPLSLANFLPFSESVDTWVPLAGYRDRYGVELVGLQKEEGMLLTCKYQGQDSHQLSFNLPEYITTKAERLILGSMMLMNEEAWIEGKNLPIVFIEQGYRNPKFIRDDDIVERISGVALPDKNGLHHILRDYVSIKAWTEQIERSHKELTAVGVVQGIRR